MPYVDCGCKPGTEENGWHEIRSAACVREESRIFAESIARAMKEFRRDQRRGLWKRRGTP